MSSTKQKPCFVLEGNIGAGKSTFLKILGKYLNAQLVFEPHNDWQHVGGENLLDKFYTDAPRWAYTFQSYAFISRIKEQEKFAKINNFHFQILERSVYSDRYCFAKNCFELGLMTALEWQLYHEWFGWLVTTYTSQPTAFIYLRTDPEICFERIKFRGRQEEKDISLDYIQLLHRKHEDWLIHKKDIEPFLQNVPVITLNCDEDFEFNLTKQKEHIRTIVNFLETDCNIPQEQSIIATAL